MSDAEPIPASLPVNSSSGVDRTPQRPELARPLRSASVWLSPLLLLVGAWLLTMLRFVSVDADPVSVTSRSLLTPVVLTGALPWLLQWLSVALLAGMVLIRRFELQRSVVRPALAVTLVVGLAWWIGLAWFRLHANVATPFADQLAYHLQRNAGTEPLGRSVLYEVLGPLMNPIALSGSVTLTGAGFWKQLGSTLLVTAVWSVGAALLSWAPAGRPGRSRRTFALAAVVFLYNAPVLLRAILRLAQSIDIK